MSGGDFRVSPWQVEVLVFVLGLCVTPLGLVAPVVAVLGRRAWLAAVPALAVGLWGTAVALALARRRPARPLDVAVLEVLGPVAGYPYLAALALCLAAGAPVNLEVFGRTANLALLTRMPAYVAILLTAAVGTYAAALGPEAIARVAEVLAPVLAFGLAAVYAAPLGQAEPGRLLPLGVGPWRSFLAPPVLTLLGSVRGFLPLLVLGPFARPAPRARVLLAAAAAAFLIALALALPVAVFGFPFARTLSDPFYALVDTFSWRWLPIERVVVVAVLVWHAIGFLVFATYVWLGAWLGARLARRGHRPALALAVGAGATLAACWQAAGPEVRWLLEAWNGAVVVLGVLVPTLVLLRARVGDRRAAPPRRRLRAARAVPRGAGSRVA